MDEAKRIKQEAALKVKEDKARLREAAKEETKLIKQKAALIATVSGTDKWNID